jgi:hypothetical protein
MLVYVTKNDICFLFPQALQNISLLLHIKSSENHNVKRNECPSQETSAMMHI